MLVKTKSTINRSSDSAKTSPYCSSNILRIDVATNSVSETCAEPLFFQRKTIAIAWRRIQVLMQIKHWSAKFLWVVSTSYFRRTSARIIGCRFESNLGFISVMKIIVGSLPVLRTFW